MAKEVSPTSSSYSSSRFYVTIPDSFTVYEISWAYSNTDSNDYAKLDGGTFVKGPTGSITDKKRYGSFDSTDFEKGVEHELEVYTPHRSTTCYLGLVIIYKE